VVGDPAGGLLVVGWGSTYGAITGAVRRARAEGRRVSHMHLRYLNPMPKNVKEVLERYDEILVPEMNTGQLAFLLQGRFLRPVIKLDKIQGQPFKESEILDAIREHTQKN
jgi:2-oxoglutarate ferredoxin oxidoreductase subunit alpha